MYTCANDRTNVPKLIKNFPGPAAAGAASCANLIFSSFYRLLPLLGMSACG
jgi:hypothetical protein